MLSSISQVVFVDQYRYDGIAYNSGHNFVTVTHNDFHEITPFSLTTTLLRQERLDHGGRRVVDCAGACPACGLPHPSRHRVVR